MKCFQIAVKSINQATNSLCSVMQGNASRFMQKFTVHHNFHEKFLNKRINSTAQITIKVTEKKYDIASNTTEILSHGIRTHTLGYHTIPYH